MSLETVAQARAKFTRDSGSHMNWACLVFISSPSEDSNALDSEFDSFDAESCSESKRNGFTLRGAGGDRSGESA